MSKVLEETWFYDDKACVVFTRDGVLQSDDPHDPYAVLKLAGMAPAMARMLAKWWNCGFKDSDYGATCPECMGEQDFSDAVAMRNEVRLKHEPDCELDLLLRKAGVLP